MAKKLDSQLNKPQRNIKTIVEDYKWLFKVEYQDFLQWIKEVQKQQENKFATITGQEDEIIQRKLGEVPETLHVMFQKRLDTEDREYLRSKKGSRWFYKTFKEFRVTKDI